MVVCSDCLDDKDNGMYYDGFSDREAVRNALVVPDYLFSAMRLVTILTSRNGMAIR